MISNRVFFGIVGGAAVGAAAALLLAPKSGQELRTQLRDAAQQLTKDFEAFLASVGQSREIDVAHAGDKSISPEARRKADEIMQQANSILSDLKRNA